MMLWYFIEEKAGKVKKRRDRQEQGAKQKKEIKKKKERKTCHKTDELNYIKHYVVGMHWVFMGRHLHGLVPIPWGTDSCVLLVLGLWWVKTFKSYSKF